MRKFLFTGFAILVFSAVSSAQKKTQKAQPAPVQKVQPTKPIAETNGAKTKTSTELTPEQKAALAKSREALKSEEVPVTSSKNSTKDKKEN